jgi:hypothetical protein
VWFFLVLNISDMTAGIFPDILVCHCSSNNVAEAASMSYRKLRTGIVLIAVILMLNSGCSSSSPSVENPSKTGEKPNVILIHGYGNIFAPRSETMEWVMTEFYWERWVNEAFSSVETKYIYWDSTQRIEKQLGNIVSQFNRHLDAGHCPKGCIVVTHSTGGLVIDVLLSRAYESRGKSNDFSRIWDKSIFSLNVASAAGGVGLATTMTDMVMGNCNILLSSIVPFVECGKPSTMGAGHDLRPDEARFINQSDNVRTPSLMIAGFGLMMPSLIRLSLKGTNDGLVAMHSACGGNSYPLSEDEAPESCSPFQAPNGEIKSQKSPDLYRNHYPIIMTKEGHVSQLHSGLLNFDFISTKTETLVFYDHDGGIIKPPLRFENKKYLNVGISSSHLTDIVGDFFNLRNEPLDDDVDPNQLGKEEFHDNLVAIANAYEKSLAYPVYSRLLNADDHSLLHPHQSYPVYKSYLHETYSAAILLPRYVFFEDSTIPVTLRLQSYEGSSIPKIVSVQAEIIDQDGEISVRFDLPSIKSESSEKLFQFDYKPADKEIINWSEEVNLRLTFTTAGGSKNILTKMFKYLPSIASINGKGQENVSGSHLVIPLHIDVEGPGDYKITANLFSQRTGEPVAHLMEECSIQDFFGTVELKVHSMVLKKKNAPGPYLLKNLVITRIPDSFQEPRMFGDTRESTFEIQGFDLDQYAARPYLNPYEQKKLRKFQKFVD